MSFKSESPHLFHKACKVLGVIDWAAYGVVIGIPLISVDAPVPVFVAEVRQKFKEHFVLGQLAGDHSRMQISRHHCLQLTGLNRVRVPINELVKSLVNELLSFHTCCLITKVIWINNGRIWIK